MTDNFESRKLPPINKPKPGLPTGLPKPNQAGGGLPLPPKATPPTAPSGGTKLPPSVPKLPTPPQSIPQPPVQQQPQQPPTFNQQPEQVQQPPMQQQWQEQPPAQQYPSQQQYQGGYPPQQNDWNQQQMQQQGGGQFMQQPQQPPTWEEQYQQPQQPVSSFQRQPEPEEIDEEEEDVTPRGRKRGAKKPPPKSSKGRKAAKKGSKSSDEKKLHPYSGSRKKLLYTQIAVFGSLGLLVLLGIISLIPKSSYLTENDKNVVIAKVREDLGETYFPKEAGEGWAQGFLETYLTIDPERSEQRKEQLLTYTTEDTLKEIDVSFLTDADIEQLSGKEKPTNEDLAEIAGITNTKKQVITAGPYLVKKEMLPGDNSALFSYRLQINGNGWAYVEVPVYYDMKNRALAVSGTPTFRSIIPIAKPPLTEYAPTFENDPDVSKKIATDIPNYLKAWVASDQTSIDRYLVKESGDNVVTPQAATGLGGSVKFLSINKMTVEFKPMPKGEDLTPESKADFNQRYVFVSMSVVEPTSGVVYNQNYQLVIQYVNENWFVQDIRNVSIFADKTVKAEKTEEK